MLLRNSEDFLNVARCWSTLQSGTVAAENPFKDFRTGALPLPSTYQLPRTDFVFSNLDTIDDSASGLLEQLDRLVGQWRKELPADAQPVIFAILANGAIIEAREFSEAGQNGIGIRGRLLSDGSECLVLAHQASLQLLCRVIKAEDPEERYPIGFRYAAKAPSDT